MPLSATSALSWEVSQVSQRGILSPDVYLLNGKIGWVTLKLFQF